LVTGTSTAFLMHNAWNREDVRWRGQGLVANQRAS
jgi:hypothetical protein